MGLELDLYELAALRPIRTAVSGARAAARPEDDGEGAADIGCVTPRASDSMAQRQDRVDTGCVAPTASTGGTARRVCGGGEDGAAGTGCVTPTSAASALRPATACPPAPRKPMAAKRKRCGRPPPPRFFPVPHDLATVFVARAAASPPLCPPTKKIRVHVVV